MKPYTYAFLAAAAACGMAYSADTAYTTPVGYTTQALAANTFNLVGFNVLTPTVAAGDLTGVSGATLSDSGVDFTTLLTAGKTYVLDIKDGPGTADGTVQEFVTWSGSDITLPSAVAGVAVGDKYSIRQAPTLQATFPVGFLAGSVSATNADKVWVPNGSGGYTKYWYKITLPPIGWHTTGTGLDDTGVVTADVPLIYIDGIFVEKKGVAKDLVLSGEVKTTGSNVLVNTGFNPVGITPPVGLTLFTSGLQGDIAGSVSATNADKVWVPNGLGGYTKYWYKITLPPIGWHTTTTGLDDTGVVATDVTLTPAIFIERKGASKVVTMDVPSSYSSL